MKIYRESFDFQLSSNLMDYELIEKMNQAASKNVENMKKVTDEIVVTNDDLNTKFSKRLEVSLNQGV